jgi:pyruvate dehydrogenase E1 component alpha subunit
MNLASSQRIPVLFVCEHNLFASHLHISLRQPAESVARFASAHRVPYWTLDGNDVLAVAAATKAATDLVRHGGGPAFLELVTYRWRGHVGPNDDQDVGVRRSDDLSQWRRRDPLARLELALTQGRDVDAEVFATIDAELRREAAHALEAARAAALPSWAIMDESLFSPREIR